MNPATRYSCRYCGAHRFLPERPLSPTPRVNVGCATCENITPHAPVGSVQR